MSEGKPNGQVDLAQPREVHRHVFERLQEFVGERERYLSAMDECNWSPIVVGSTMKQLAQMVLKNEQVIMAAMVCLIGQVGGIGELIHAEAQRGSNGQSGRIIVPQAVARGARR